MLVDGDKVKVHFKGWGREDGKSKWDEWMEQGSERMCALDTKSAEPPEEEDVAYQPSRLWVGRVKGGKLAINEKHVDFPAVLCEALDCIWREQDVKAASTQLGISTSQMVKLLAKEPTALQVVNGLRASSGLPPLRN